MAISMLKIRRPLGRLIFNMGIAIPGKTVFLIETAPWRVLSVLKAYWVRMESNFSATDKFRDDFFIENLLGPQTG